MTGSTAGGYSPPRTAPNCTPSASAPCLLAWCAPQRCRQIPLHGLRHTYASLALAKGVNAAIVSRRLGHATVAFTLDIYSHVLPQVDAEAAEVIASYDAT